MRDVNTDIPSPVKPAETCVWKLQAGARERLTVAIYPSDEWLLDATSGQKQPLGVDDVPL